MEKEAFNELMEVADQLKNVTSIDPLLEIMNDLYSNYILPEELNNERN